MIHNKTGKKPRINQKILNISSFSSQKKNQKIQPPAGARNCGLMRTGTLSCNKAFTRPYSCRPLTPPASFRHQQLNFPLLSSRHANGGRRFHRLKCAAAVDRGSTESISSWDDEPYEVLPNGEIAYLDEQDVVTFLDPPKTLRPIDPSSYNPATYLW